MSLPHFSCRDSCCGVSCLLSGVLCRTLTTFREFPKNSADEHIKRAFVVINPCKRFLRSILLNGSLGTVVCKHRLSCHFRSHKILIEHCSIMDVFCSKQSIALTVIFSYLISLPNGENQAVSSQPELQKFLILNKMIYQSFNLNETFWLWYIYYVFKCDLCLADAHNLNNATEKLKLNRRNSNLKTSKTSEKSEKLFSKCCFWKRECKIQYANRRIRRQWCIKFSSRVLTHKNVPIIKSRTYRTEYSKIHTM